MRKTKPNDTDRSNRLRITKDRIRNLTTAQLAEAAGGCDTTSITTEVVATPPKR